MIKHVAASYVYPESEILQSHFPTEFKQCRKFDQRSDLCFLKAKRVYKKTSLNGKSLVEDVHGGRDVATCHVPENVSQSFSTLT